MRPATLLPAFVTALFFSCSEQTASKQHKATGALPIQGTWRLLSGTMVTKNDTVVTDYTRGQEMLKIINDSHFAFVRHDLSHGKDSAAAIYSSGAGRYTISDNQYVEHLDFCDAREWEGHTFTFTVSLHKDTLVQKGVERLENLGIDRVITEKYLRVK